MTGLGSLDLASAATVWPVNSGSSATLIGTTTKVSVSNTTPAAGANDTITITVASRTGSGIPTGTVTLLIDGGIKLGGTTAGAQSLSATGTVTYTTSFASAGTHQVLAQYAGDSTFAASTGVDSVTSTVATPTFSFPPGTYTSAQTVSLSDSTPGAVIYYTTNGTTPTTSSTIYTAPILVSTTETIQAIATAAGDSASPVATAMYVINLPAAMPTFSIPTGTYTSAQTVAIFDSTPGAVVYYTTDGTTPTLSSNLYNGPITVSAAATIEAIAIATGYSASPVTLAVYTITNPAPAVSSMTPAYAVAGGAAFTLTVNGSGFIPGSTVYWGTRALPTTYVKNDQLTAQVTAVDIAQTGQTSVSAQTPSPGGGTSNILHFEIDSSSSGSPQFNSATATVIAGSTATYAVNLPSTATNVSVQCLNLPQGAPCSYSAGSVSIATAPNTPAGTYQITVVFTETLPGATSALALISLLFLPAKKRKNTKATRDWWTLGTLALLLGVACSLMGCGGGGSGSSSGNPPTTSTHTVTSSGVVTLTVK